MKDHELEGRRPEDTTQRRASAGASPPDDSDERALRGDKSEWVEDRKPSAGNPISNDELAAFDLLGREDVRDDTIPPVSGMNDVPQRPGAGPGRTRDEQGAGGQGDDERAR